MKTLSTSLIVSILFLSLSSSAATAQEPLRWKLQKGERYQLQTKQQSQSLVSFATKKLASTVDLTLDVGWEVSEADADKFSIVQTIDAIRIEMKGPGEAATTYDSRERKAVVGAAKDLATAVAPLLGSRFTISMTAQGEITAAEQAIEKPAEPIGAAEAAKELPINKEAIGQLLRQSLVPLPKVFEGSNPSWTDERKTTAALGEVKQTRTFTLAGTEDRDGKPAAQITVKGDLELTPTAGAKSPAVVKEQTLKGTIWFAKEPGRLLSSETTQRLLTESKYRDSLITVDLTTIIHSSLKPRE